MVEDKELVLVVVVSVIDEGLFCTGCCGVVINRSRIL